MSTFIPPQCRDGKQYVCTYVAFCNTSLGTDDEDSEPNGRALIASHNYLHKVCS